MTSLLKCPRKRKRSALEDEGDKEQERVGAGEKRSNTNLPISMVKCSPKTNITKVTKTPVECRGSVAMGSHLEEVWREQERER